MTIKVAKVGEIAAMARALDIANRCVVYCQCQRNANNAGSEKAYPLYSVPPLLELKEAAQRIRLMMIATSKAREVLKEGNK